MELDCDQDLNDSEPILPHDIERLIFETAAYQARSSGDIYRLLFIAKRVHKWIRPFLYRILIRGTSTADSIAIHWEGDSNIIPPASIPIDGIGLFVRHLMISTKDEIQVGRLLELCPLVEDLAIWNGRTPNLALLRHLSLKDFSATLNKVTAEDFAMPPFTTISHLDIIDSYTDWRSTYQHIAQLPRITHLCLNIQVDIDVIYNLLKECSTLRILISLILYRTYGRDSDAEYITIEDPRLVLINEYDDVDVSRDWIAHAKRNDDIWAFAEQICEIRTRLSSDIYYPAQNFSRGLWQ